ncbi:MAG: hypothetical protein QM725_13190 [Lacibacter sp.]
MEQLIVNKKGRLDAADNSFSPAVKVMAVLFSYLFHPLFVIAWVSLYLIYYNHYIFTGIEGFDKLKIFLSIFSTNIFLPLITVLLLKGLGFIQSIQLRTQKERIIPYVACITFFFWSYYVSRQLQYPLELRAFLLSAFIAASVSLLFNNYMKISMHAISAGGLTALFILLLFNNKVDDGLSLLLAFLAAGITCTSRFIASDHKPQEIYTGFITGLIIQIIAWFIAL